MNFCRDCRHVGGDADFPFCKKTLSERIDYITKDTRVNYIICLMVRQGPNEKHCVWFEPKMKVTIWMKIKSLFKRESKLNEF